jgi:hypothetical protein
VVLFFIVASEDCLRGLFFRVFLPFLSAFLAVPASAQTFRARLMDASAGVPVRHAFAMLIDSTGNRAVATLSDSLGAVMLRAPRAGSYRLRVERLGYRTYEGVPMVVDGTQAAGDVAMSGIAVVLDSIRIGTESKCRGRWELSAEVSALWEEARKALAVSSWVARTGEVRYTVREYDRVLTTARLAMLSEDTSSAFLISEGSPYVSRAAADLIANGFVQRNDRGVWFYFGPDADVLQSPEFLDSHCFRPVLSEAASGEVGLRFEPVGKGPRAGINGVIWLDRMTGSLKSVEFRFTWTPFTEPYEDAGGHIEFEQLEGGRWIISRWWLRAPRFGPRMLNGRITGRAGVVVYDHKEREVVSATLRDGRVIPVGSR